MKASDLLGFVGRMGKPDVEPLPMGTAFPAIVAISLALWSLIIVAAKTI